jgi:fatty-acyl-CoA synthase
MQMKLSYVHGIGDVPLKYQTVGQAFDETVHRFANREALVVVHQGVRWTYTELAERVDRLAAGLLALGLHAGDRLGIWAPNCGEWVITQFASAKAGLILVNINPAYRASELEYCLKKVGCRALVSAERLKSSDYLRMLQSLIPEAEISRPDGELRCSRFPDLKWIIRLGEGQTPGFLNFDEVTTLGKSAAHLARLAEIQIDLQPDDAINIQFTSGTTGTPKGATLSHHNILNNGYFVGRYLQLTEHDRICVPVPLYHCFGMVMGNLAAITHGSAIIYPADTFDPKATLETVASERATALYGVPTMFIAELEQPDFSGYDLSSLRTGIMAGSPCPIEVMKRVTHKMHIRDITICYGMTETSPVSFQSSTDDPLEKRVSTVGRVHPHIQAKVVDGSGRCVARGVQGELHTRGYSVMKGYWNDPEKTREVLDDAGWMHTGDLGVIDGDGYCRITGRLKDVVIRGGENIYPREIEEFLHSHPKVQSVQVCGVPDHKFGEEVCAWIQLKLGMNVTEDDIREYCRERIAHYKVPRYVRFVQGFPMTTTGKVQKYAMREHMLRELSLPEKGSQG